MPLKSEERMTIFLSLGGTTLMRKTHTAHNNIDDTASRKKKKKKLQLQFVQTHIRIHQRHTEHNFPSQHIDGDDAEDGGRHSC